MAPPVPDARHRQLRQLVVDRVRADILEGKLASGTWVRQERIAKELGVSQMPVREALRELAAEGLVEHAPYRGVRVACLTAEDAEDLFAARAAVEALAAHAAAERITPEEIAELKRLNREMKQRLAPKHLAKYRELNRRFHTVLYTASRRPFLIRTLHQFWSAFPTMLLTRFEETAIHPIPGRDAEDLAEHLSIVEALERHDPKATVQAVRVHLEKTSRRLMATLKSHEPRTVPSEVLGATRQQVRPGRIHPDGGTHRSSSTRLLQP
jgi:DNA-binding GntR family transcriptional regulator